MSDYEDDLRAGGVPFESDYERDLKSGGKSYNPGIFDRVGESVVDIWTAAKDAVKSVTGPESNKTVPVDHINAPTGNDISPPPGMDPVQQDFDAQRYFLAKQNNHPTDNIEREMTTRGWTIRTPAPPMQPRITNTVAPPTAPPSDPWAYPTPTSFADVKAAGVGIAALPGDLLSQAIAGYTGLTTLATGGGLEKAGKTIESTVEALSPTAAVQPLLSKETAQAHAIQSTALGAMIPPGGVLGQTAEALGVDEKYTPLIEAGTNILAIGGPTAWHMVKPSVLKALGPDRLYNDPYVRPLGEVLREEVTNGRMSPRAAADIVTSVWQTGDRYFGVAFRDPNWLGKFLGAESPYYVGAVRGKGPAELGPGPGPEPTGQLPPGPIPPRGGMGGGTMGVLPQETPPGPVPMPERFPMKEGVDYSRDLPRPHMLNEAPGPGIWRQATGGRPGMVVRPNVPVKGKIGEAWVAPTSDLPHPPPPVAPPAPISPKGGLQVPPAPQAVTEAPTAPGTPEFYQLWPWISPEQPFHGTARTEAEAKGYVEGIRKDEAEKLDPGNPVRYVGEQMGYPMFQQEPPGVGSFMAKPGESVSQAFARAQARYAPAQAAPEPVPEPPKETKPIPPPTPGEKFTKVRKDKVSEKQKAMEQTPIARVRKGGGIKFTDDIAGEIRTYASRKEGGNKATAIQMLMRRKDKNPKGYAGAMAWDKWIQTFQEDGTLPEGAGIGDLFDLLLENKPGKGSGIVKTWEITEENAPTEEHLAKISAEIDAESKKAAELEKEKQKQAEIDSLKEPRGDARADDVTADDLESAQGVDGKWRVFADEAEVAGPFKTEAEAKGYVEGIRKDEATAKEEAIKRADESLKAQAEKKPIFPGEKAKQIEIAPAGQEGKDGLCYKNVFQALTKDNLPEKFKKLENIRAVHGELMVTDKKTGQEKLGGHAWFEGTAGKWEFVYDPTLEITLPKNQYYARARVKEGSTTEYTQRELTQTTVAAKHYGPFHEKVVQAKSTATKGDFIKMGQQQRGKPEGAMRDVQDMIDSPAMNTAIEKTGDLTHRMNDANLFEGAGYANVKFKVEDSIDSLEGLWGMTGNYTDFAGDLEAGIKRIAKKKGIDPKQHRKDVYAALNKYADAHRALPAFNEAHRIARGAAIALGELRFDDALKNLRTLKEHLGSREEWVKYAREGLAEDAPKGEPFKLDTEESPTAEAPLIPETAGEQPEIPGMEGERAKYRASEKPPPAAPPEGGLFAAKPKVDIPNKTMPVEGDPIDALKRDLERKGAGRIGESDYKITTYGPDDAPAVERVHQGDRQTILGWSGNKFESRNQAINWAVDDAKTKSAANGTAVQSKGHLDFIGDTEFYVREDGRLYKAPVSSPVMTDGYRSGRFESEPRKDWGPTLNALRAIEARRRGGQAGAVKTDIITAVVKAMLEEAGTAIKRPLSAIFPTLISKEHLRAAQTLGNHMVGYINRAAAMNVTLFKKDHTMFIKAGVHKKGLDPDKNIGFKFMSDKSMGRPMSPDMQKIADRMDTIEKNDAKLMIQAGADPIKMRQNYFAGMWKDKTAAANFMAKRPFKGSESFRKGKVFEDWMDGIKAGLEPISPNPIDIFWLKRMEVTRSIAANRALREFEADDRVIFNSIFKGMPEGYAKIDDKMADVYGPPEMNVVEYIDKRVYEGLLKIADSIGIKHERKISAGRDKLGYAERGTGQIVTQFATEISVLAHEISHQLDFKYDLWNEIVKKAEGVGKKGEVTKAASQKQRGLIMKELRALADLHWEGQQVPQHHKNYVRKKVEQMATLLEAYIHVPGQFRDVAPNVFDAFNSFLNSIPELKPFTKIKPGLVLTELRNVQRLPGFPLIGHRIATIPVANIMNNFLSKSLYNNPYIGHIYKGIMWTGNMLNQTQLGGGSQFHGGFTTLEVQIWAGAHILEDLYGLVQGNRTLGDLGRTIARYPIAMASGPVFGAKLLKEWNTPGTMGFKMAQIAEAAELAGAGFQLERGLRTNHSAKAFQDWYSNRKALAVLKSPFILIEQLARPIMDYLVPRQKAVVFTEMAGRIIEQNPGVPLEDLRPEFRKAWNMVDGSMGQVLYNRIFMRNAVKGIIQMLIRAPGWTGGTIYLIGKSPFDAGAFFREWIKTGKTPQDIPPTVAYTISLLLTTALINGLLTYAFTGEDPEGLDFLAFRDGGIDEYGKKTRFLIPTYAKEIYAWMTNPKHTALAKMHPQLSVEGEIQRGTNYYNERINNPDDAWYQQQYDDMVHRVKAFEPFYIRGIKKNLERRVATDRALNDVLHLIAPIFGVMPATRAYTQSPAEKLMGDMSQEYAPKGGYTKEQKEYTKFRSEVKQMLRNGMTYDDMPEDVQSRLDKLTPRQRNKIEADANMTGFALGFEKKSLDDKMRLWKKMDPVERAEVDDSYNAAIDRRLNELVNDPDALNALREKVEAAE